MAEPLPAFNPIQGWKNEGRLAYGQHWRGCKNRVKPDPIRFRFVSRKLSTYVWL